jgi:hypothetical protein
VVFGMSLQRGGVAGATEIELDVTQRGHRPFCVMPNYLSHGNLS